MSVTSTLTLAMALSCGLFPAAEGSLLGLFGRGSKGIGTSCGQEGGLSCFTGTLLRVAAIQLKFSEVTPCAPVSAAHEVPWACSHMLGAKGISKSNGTATA